MSQSNFLQALGWAVLNSLWQMALLWVLYQVIIFVVRISKPAQKTSLAVLFLLGGFAWFIFTFISVPANSSSYNSVINPGFISEYGNEKLNDWLHTTLPVASGIYLFLLVLPVWRFLRNYNYVKQISRLGLSKIDVEWRMFVKRISEQMNIRKKVQIWVSDVVSSPVTVGFLKPMILVPFAAINNLTPQQLEAVLLHELSHIKRYDYLLNLVINLIQTIFYYNPFVKAFVQIIEREREKSCDEMVIQFQYDPHGYASALLILEKANHFSRPLAVAASGKKNDLLQRVELIIGIKRKPVISFNKLAGLFAGVLCVIALNGLLMFNKHQQINKDFSLNSLSSPFYFFAGENINQPAAIVKQDQPSVNKAEKKDVVLVAKATPKNDAEKEEGDVTIYKTVPPNVPAPLFVNVKYTPEIVVPRLNSSQEEQIKAAMEASKKVVKEEQWKTVEKSIADVMTTAEKDDLKKAYLKKLNTTVDWSKMEDKLRTSYDQINWEQINAQLGTALTEIRLDSIQHVYSVAANYLEDLQKQMIEYKQKGISDSNLTLDSIEAKKSQVEKVLTTIRSIRSKKIIHL